METESNFDDFNDTSINQQDDQIDDFNAIKDPLTTSNVHEEKKSTQNDNKLFKCSDCNLNYRSMKAFTIHVSKVHGDQKKKYPCTVCEKKFSRKDYWKLHIESVHEGIKPFKCQMCDKNFPLSHSLKVHVKYVHERTGPLPKLWQCDQCEKKFTGIFFIISSLIPMCARSIML